MDIGLYNLKYPVRKAMQGLLPRFRTTDPNAITWSVLPVGAATAAFAWWGAHHVNGAWSNAIALVFLRMFLTTLDGFVAQSYGRETRVGAMLNRVVPELCDAMLVGTLAFARPVAWGLVPWSRRRSRRSPVSWARRRGCPRRAWVPWARPTGSRRSRWPRSWRRSNRWTAGPCTRCSCSWPGAWRAAR